MKKLFLISFLFLLKSVYADFFVQYDNSGNILGTVTSIRAPIVSGRNQIAFTEAVDLTGKLIEVAAVTNGSKYVAASAPQKTKIDPVFASVMAVEATNEEKVESDPNKDPVADPVKTP